MTENTITVYTKPACVQCNATGKALDKNGLDYTVVDITTNDQARESQCVCQAVSAAVSGGAGVNSRSSRMSAQVTSTCFRATARRA